MLRGEREDQFSMAIAGKTGGKDLKRNIICPV